MLNNIQEVIEKINFHVFVITRTLNASGRNDNGETKPICPNCKSEFLRCRFDNHCAKITCHKCFWEQNYVRIHKNHEVIELGDLKNQNDI